MTRRHTLTQKFRTALALAVFLWCGPSATHASECRQLCDSDFWKSATLAAVRAVLAGGADVHARDEDGETPMHAAVRSNATLAVVAALLEAGADLTAKNEAGKTSFDLIRENTSRNE